MTDRERLPRNRKSVTHDFHIGPDGAEQCSGFLTIGFYDDGRPGEVFVDIAKTGSFARGTLDAVAILVSHTLQWGVPAPEVVDALTNRRFEPLGSTDDPDVPQVSSVVDYIGRRLAADAGINLEAPAPKLA